MLRKYRKTLILTSVTTMLPTIIGMILWSRLPERVATHFGADNVADGYSSKAFAVFGLPAVILALHWLSILITNTDPKKKNIFSTKAFGLVLWICPAVSLLLAAMVYGYALDSELRIGTIIMTFMGILFMVIGNYLPKCKQNFSLGFKTPWALNDEENWNRTNRFAGRVMVIGSVFILLTAFLENPVILFVLISVMCLLPTVYSYILFKRKEG